MTLPRPLTEALEEWLRDVKEHGPDDRYARSPHERAQEYDRVADELRELADQLESKARGLREPPQELKLFDRVVE